MSRARRTGARRTGAHRTPAGRTPAALGYRLPAEWEPHAATWLSWPHNRDTWPGQFEPIPGVWAQLVRALVRFEQVHILAGGEQVMASARENLAGLPLRVGPIGRGDRAEVNDGSRSVWLHDVRTNDAWTRDHGPMFLAGPAGAPPALVHWGYNAWGGKYPPYDLDQQVPRRIAEILGYERFEAGIVLEGGAIDVNGAGSLMTTEQCLLNPNRNPGLAREAIEQHLADYCAAGNIIWLGEGIAGDDTDGHIDELARFVAPRIVVAAVEQDPSDPNHRPLADNLRRLALARDQDNRSLEVVPLPMPRAHYFGEARLPCSYLNFYIANDLVVIPQYEDPADATALEILGRVFASREVVGLRALELAWGLGAFHCITHEQVAGTLRGPSP